MSKHLQYQGYIGSIEVDIDEGFLYGRLLFIRDVVSYRSDDVIGLRAAFHEAVDDYVKTCIEMGDTPDQPCKGTFNVRIGPELHRLAALAAEAEASSLNEWMKSACTLRLASVLSERTAEPVKGRKTSLTATAEDDYVSTGAREWQPQAQVTH